jgi:hypothetical protein
MSAKGRGKGAETEPSAEEAWERLGYAGAALNAATTAFESAMADVERCGVYLAPRLVEVARDRGKARWLAEHPEARE